MAVLIGALIGALIGLIGVILVSIIGYAAVITTLVVEHRRWKKEFKLQYLITERVRREKQCDKIRELLKQGLHDDLYHFDLALNMWGRLPKNVKSPIIKAWDGIDLSDDKVKRKLYLEVSVILGKYLVSIDKQIEELTQ